MIFRTKYSNCDELQLILKSLITILIIKFGSWGGGWDYEIILAEN